MEKSCEKAPKTFQNGAQDGPREASKLAVPSLLVGLGGQDASRPPKDRPKTAQRLPPDFPGVAQDVPKTPSRGPKIPQDPQKTAQNRPRGAQDRPRIPQQSPRGVKRRPREVQEGTGGAFEAVPRLRRASPWASPGWSPCPLLASKVL